MKKLICLLAIVLATKTALPQMIASSVTPQGKYTISGTVTDAATGEEMIGATRLQPTFWATRRNRKM